MADLTRRGFLGSAAAAVAAVSLPFGLKPEDLEEVVVPTLDLETPEVANVPDEARFKLEPDEILVCLAELVDPKAGAKEVAVYSFLEDEGALDDVPIIRYRIDPEQGGAISFVVGQFWGVVVKADEGVRIRIRAHVAGQWVDAGTLFG